MRPFLAALMLCSMTAHVVALAFPFQATARPLPEKVIVVSVCDPPKPKDQSRMLAGLLIPKLVTTERIVPPEKPTQPSERKRRADRR